MHARFVNAYRRLRYGSPVIVVSGLPRSGTSMTMRMLQRAGVDILADGVRPADASNPHGYFEFEHAKRLHQRAHPSWLRDARGKAVKVISFFLPYLPQNLNYQVLFMQRDLHEIIASQRTMLARRGEDSGTADDRMRQLYERHLQKIQYILSRRRCFRSLDLYYPDVVHHPHSAADRINRFLGGGLDVERMVAAVDDRLYRNRQ